MGQTTAATASLSRSTTARRSQANLSRGKWSWKLAASTIKISDGAHTLKIKSREDGASVDKILLVKDKSYKPSDLGEAALAFQCR